MFSKQYKADVKEEIEKLKGRILCLEGRHDWKLNQNGQERFELCTRCWKRGSTWKLQPKEQQP